MDLLRANLELHPLSAAPRCFVQQKPITHGSAQMAVDARHASSLVQRLGGDSTVDRAVSVSYRFSYPCKWQCSAFIRRSNPRCCRGPRSRGIETDNVASQGYEQIRNGNGMDLLRANLELHPLSAAPRCFVQQKPITHGSAQMAVDARHASSLVQRLGGDSAVVRAVSVSYRFSYPCKWQCSAFIRRSNPRCCRGPRSRGIETDNSTLQGYEQIRNGNGMDLLRADLELHPLSAAPRCFVQQNKCPRVCAGFSRRSRSFRFLSVLLSLQMAVLRFYPPFKSAVLPRATITRDRNG